MNTDVVVLLDAVLLVVIVPCEVANVVVVSLEVIVPLLVKLALEVLNVVVVSLLDAVLL